MNQSPRNGARGGNKVIHPASTSRAARRLPPQRSHSSRNTPACRRIPYLTVLFIPIIRTARYTYHALFMEAGFAG